jgi:hypothetical protein
MQLRCDGQWQILGHDLPAERCRETGEWRAWAYVALDEHGGPAADWRRMAARDRAFGTMARVYALGVTAFDAYRNLKERLERFLDGDVSDLESLKVSPKVFHTID